MFKPKFRTGDTITDGTRYLTIQYHTKTSYKTTNGQWMPIALVDKFWALVNDEEAEIIDED